MTHEKIVDDMDKRFGSSMTSYEVVSNFALYGSIESEFEVTFGRVEPSQSFEFRKMT